MKSQLHASGVSLLLKCGVAYERRYIRGEKIPPAVALHVGSSVHKTINKNLSAKIHDGHPLTLESIGDIARDDFAARWQNEGVSLDKDEKAAGAAFVKGEAIDKAVNLSRLHATALAPSLEPAHVERPFVLDVNGYDFQLAGTIDQQYGTQAVRDVKTASKSPNKDAAETSRQLTLYALGVWAEERKIPELVVLDHLIETPAKKELKTVSLASERSMADFDSLLNTVQRAVEGIEKGIFYPAPQGAGAWWCSEKFCGYWDTCPFPRKPVTVGAPDLTQKLKDSLIQIGG